MAEFSIDQNRLPGVKEVCRDFAVLEDHCLAHNLQEQEIESHLASNVHKSRLVQKDLQVAKRLQEEEDLRAKAQSQRQFRDIERQDNEIAQEIQEELVRQAEQQKRQEEKDAAIARKLQEKEMKEEKRRQKQKEANFEEEYYDDKGVRDRTTHCVSGDDRFPPGRYNDPYHDCPIDCSSSELKRSRHPRQEPVVPHSCSKYPEHRLVAEGGRSRNADPYPEHSLPPRVKGQRGEESERLARQKEKPARPPPPYIPAERDEDRGRDRVRLHGQDTNGHRERDRRGRERVQGGQSRERRLSGDRKRYKDQDGHRARTRSRERGLEEDSVAGHSEASWEGKDLNERERRRARGARLHSSPGEELEEHLGEGPSKDGSHSHPSTEKGHASHRGAPLAAAGEYGLGDATQGLARLDLRDQELRDMEVARRLQEEEMKSSKRDKHAAQVAQDEEIARLLMEQEKKEYKRSKEKERERDRERLAMEREKLAMERRRLEPDYRASAEEVVRPRSREEYEHQKQRNHNKPARPPQPRTHDYENVNSSSGYVYSDNPFSPRDPARSEAAYKGAYYRQ